MRNQDNINPLTKLFSADDLKTAASLDSTSKVPNRNPYATQEKFLSETIKLCRDIEAFIPNTAIDTSPDKTFISLIEQTGLLLGFPAETIYRLADQDYERCMQNHRDGFPVTSDVDMQIMLAGAKKRLETLKSDLQGRHAFETLSLLSAFPSTYEVTSPKNIASATIDAYCSKANTNGGQYTSILSEFITDLEEIAEDFANLIHYGPKERDETKSSAPEDYEHFEPHSTSEADKIYAPMSISFMRNIVMQSIRDGAALINCTENDITQSAEIDHAALHEAYEAGETIDDHALLNILLNLHDETQAFHGALINGKRQRETTISMTCDANNALTL